MSYATEYLDAARALARGGHLGEVGGTSARWFVDNRTGGIAVVFLSRKPSIDNPISLTDGAVVQPASHKAPLIAKDELDKLAKAARGFGSELVLWLYSFTEDTDGVDVESFAPFRFVKGRTIPCERSAAPGNAEKLKEFDEKLSSLTEGSGTADKAPRIAIRTGKNGKADDFERVFYEYHTGRMRTRIVPVDDKKLKAAFKASGLASGRILGDLDALAVTEDGRVLPVDLKMRGNRSELGIGFTGYKPDTFEYTDKKDKFKRPGDSIVSSFSPADEYEFGLYDKKYDAADGKVLVGSSHQNKIYRMVKSLLDVAGPLPVAVLVYPPGDQTPDFTVDRNKASAVTPSISYHLSTVDSFDSIVGSLAFRSDFPVTSFLV